MPSTANREIANAGLDREINQYFAALTNMRSVGVMGDERTCDYAIALRAVKTIDFMTAESAQIPYEVLQKVTSRIINEVSYVNWVMYDITSKPPERLSLNSWSRAVKPCLQGFYSFFFMGLHFHYYFSSTVL